MTVQKAAAALLIILPLAFDLFFFLLGRRFDYPNILRTPTEEVLSRFKAGGVSLKLLWYGFMLTAVLLAPLAVVLGQVLARDGLAIVPTCPIRAQYRAQRRSLTVNQGQPFLCIQKTA